MVLLLLNGTDMLRMMRWTCLRQDKTDRVYRAPAVRAGKGTAGGLVLLRMHYLQLILLLLLLPFLTVNNSLWAVLKLPMASED